MAVPKLEVRRFAKTGEQTWSSSFSTFDSTSLDMSEGLETNKDMFRITFQNQNKSLTGLINVDDRIQIYLFTGASATSNDLVLDGLVTEVDHEISSTNRRLLVRGSNRTQELLSSLVLINETNETKDSSTIVEEVLNQVNNNNQSITGDIRFISFDDTSVAQTKEDASAFPNKVFVINYKPAYDAILQISDDEFTADGQYIFWIDQNNKFFWKKKTGIVFGGNTITEGIDAETISVQKGKFNVFNSIIMNTGKDAYGNGNHILQINTVSILDIGAKWKFLDRSTISANLLIAEKNANASSFTQDASGNFTNDNFPISFNYNMQFQWDSDGDGIVDTNIVSNDGEFNAAIRDQAKRLGRQAAQTFLQLHGDVVIRANAQVNGTLSFFKGAVIRLTSATAGIADKELRVNDVSHTFSSSGWKTKLQLMEDSENL